MIATVKSIFAMYLILVRGWVLMLTMGALSNVYGIESWGYWLSVGVVWVVTSLACLISGQDERDFQDMVDEVERS